MTPIPPLSVSGAEALIRRVALLGNHLPRYCGIATFTTHLASALTEVAPARGHARRRRQRPGQAPRPPDPPGRRPAVLRARGLHSGATRLHDGTTLLLCRVEDRRGLSHLCAARSDRCTDEELEALVIAEADCGRTGDRRQRQRGHPGRG